MTTHPTLDLQGTVLFFPVNVPTEWKQNLPANRNKIVLQVMRIASNFAVTNGGSMRTPKESVHRRR